MARAPMEWESRIGRRLRLRDLHILSTVVQWGSMAKAAEHLAVSQPAVSDAIANLETALAVRLLAATPARASAAGSGAPSTVCGSIAPP
jgi:molybdenum-dependent DNA-binding transcriptional regulator ModE